VQREGREKGPTKGSSWHQNVDHLRLARTPEREAAVKMSSAVASLALLPVARST
jgi:hypothetical protein